MTKFLIDENIPSGLVDFLRNRGFEVKEIRETEIHAVSDAEIMQLAFQKERVLVAFDKYFSNILVYPIDSHYGVIRIRIHPSLLSDIIQALDLFFQKFALPSFKGTLIVLEREGFRVRRAS